MINASQKLSSNLTNNKIQGHHYDRLAIIYIRQSTLQQVERHSESTKLQYGLVEKAHLMGWATDRIIVIDDDLGCSGSNVEGRPGFQRLVAEVGLDRVGLVLGIEMSRLARSCRDWYQLLEVCALFRTLIGDADGIYDPAAYNDRLLLGLKGTMSEAELHVLRQRMIEGKKNKARRGELGMRLPMGYIHRPSGEVIKDPDEQAQSNIQMVFNLFDQFLTINAVLKYLVKYKIQMPYREYSGLQKGDLVWRRPNRLTLGNMLHNPIYAGAYVYGRRPTDPRKKKPGRRSTGRVTTKISEWEVLIKDKIPAYISWEQYERNQRQLQANSIQGIGVPRQGSSLLSGLIICGRCGLRMTTQYSDNGNQLRYACNKLSAAYAEPSCQSLKGSLLDNVIVEKVLEAIKPSALEVSLKLAEDVEKERKDLLMHWQRNLERAKYEVERAYRQYNSAEPENRLVARTLEKKWEEALSAEEKLKQEYAQFISKQTTALSSSERDAIRQLASDIPALWQSSTTTAQEKQEIIRLLIERIIVTVIDKTEKVHVEIYWWGGHKTGIQITRPIANIKHLSYYKEILNHIECLQKDNRTLKEIAAILNEEGWKTAKQKGSFTAQTIGSLLASNGKKSKIKPRAHRIARLEDEWTIQELSRLVNISEVTLYSWIKKGTLKARKVKETSHGGIWLIIANEEEIKRLKDLKDQPKEWVYRSRVKKIE
jgi:DNA invertase Pin-like site-specific DNA recombinase